jgi:hypothetical protein
MTPKVLIDFFSTFTVVPIDPDKVADQIRKGGSTDDINFVGVALDIRVIRGAFHQYVRRDGLYGEPIVCVDIYYDKAQGEDWRRVVCCKELLR